MAIDITEEIERGHVMELCLKARVQRRWVAMGEGVEVTVDINIFYIKTMY